MKSGELFAGVGGLGMAVDAVFGTEPAWFAEVDEAPARVLAYRHPTVPNLGDVTRVNWDEAPRVNVLAGGFPCQDVSLAGARRGLKDGTRSGLWSEFAKAIDALRPEWVVIENVRGLLSAEAHSDVEPCPWCLGDNGEQHALRALGAVLGDLADLGFDAEWTGIRASDVGAPHGRFRIFILAWPAENTRHGLGRQAQPAPSGSDDAPLGSDSRGGRGGHDPRLTLLPTPMAQPSGNSPEEHLRKKPGREVVTDLAIIAEHGLIASGGRLGAEHATDAEWGPYATAVARWEAVLGRPAPSPVRMDGKGGKPRLNPELPEWMMGWPAGWVTGPAIGLTRAQQLKAAGNGVVPQQAAAALVEMLARPGVPAVRQEVAA